MMRELRWAGGVLHTEMRGWMLKINSHGVALSIAGYLAEMVRGPNPEPRGWPSIGVLPS